MRTVISSADGIGFRTILSNLTPKEGVVGDYPVTRSREYDHLLRSALSGRTPESIILGRFGMKLDTKIIMPQDSVLRC